MRVYNDWDQIVAALPANLTVTQAASLLHRNYTTVRKNLLQRNYPARNGHQCRFVFSPPTTRVKWEAVNWRLSNIAIARRHNVSREIVRRMRKRLGKDFVESRGRRPNKKKRIK